MRNRGPAILAIVLVAGGLTACTKPSRTPSAAPSLSPSVAASPASSGMGGASPTPTPPRPTPTPTPKRTGPGWTSVDFAKVMFKQLDCPDYPEAAGKAELHGKTMADLTGDGYADPIVAAACYTSTAANPNLVVVFDGAEPKAEPRPVLVVGRNQDLVGQVTITAKKRAVTFTSKALSARAPRCCPDREITQTYTWDGTRFDRTALVEKQIDDGTGIPPA